MLGIVEERQGNGLKGKGRKKGSQTVTVAVADLSDIRTCGARNGGTNEGKERKDGNQTDMATSYSSLAVFFVSCQDVWF